MNKQQTVWLIIRLIGVYFAYLAIIAALGLISGIYGYFSPTSASTTLNSNTAVNAGRTSVPTPRPQIPGIPTPKTEEERVAEKAAEKLKSEAGKEVLWQFFLTAIYGAVGFYLIKNGKHLFVILNREELLEESNEYSASTSTSLSKPNDKVAASPNLPVKKEEVTSLNLSDYVPMSERIKQTEVKDEQPAPPDLTSEQAAPASDFNSEIEKPVSELPNESIAPPDVSPLINEQTPVNEQVTPMDEVSILNEQPSPNEEIVPPDVSPTPDEQTWKDLQIAPPDVPVETPPDEQK